MGEELVDSSPISTPKSYTEQFYEVFPLYLSIGMTTHQFWEEDSTLVKYYRKAELLRQDADNRKFWLQGMYVYDAICSAATLIYGKKGKKAQKYPAKPYDFEENKPENKEKRAENERMKAVAFFTQLEQNFNREQRKEALRHE